MLRKAALVLAAVIYLMIGSPTRADPGPVVNWLMNEPVSLFDLGIMRLTRYLESISDSSDLAGGDASYDWDKNRIKLSWVRHENENEEIKVKEECKKSLEKVRRYGGIDSNTGTVFHRPNSTYSNFFSHFGYENKNAPEDYRRKIDQIIEISVVTNSFKSPGQAICFGPLLSTKVYFEE